MSTNLLTRTELRELKFKCGRTNLYKLSRDPAFPRPIKLATGGERFIEEEIDAYIASLAAKREPAA